MAGSNRSSAVPPPANGTSPFVESRPTRRLTAPLLLFAAGLIGLIKWVVAMLLGIGDLAHIFLLVSLMLLMLAGLKARDAATRSALATEPEKR